MSRPRGWEQPIGQPRRRICKPRRHQPIAIGLALLAPLASPRPVTAHQPAGKAGVIGLDAHAAGDQVDVLATVRVGERVELRHRRSTDGGVSWGDEHRVPTPMEPVPASRGNEPQVAGRGDVAVALWTTAGTSRFGSGPLATARSTDGGATWQPAANPADDGSTDGHGFADLAVATDGRFVAVWLDSRDGGQGLRTSTSADGLAWSANVSVDARTCECCWNRLATGVDGSLHALYRDRDPRDMALASASAGDGQQSWRRRGTAGDFGWQVEGCPHVGGGLAVLGADLVASVWTGHPERAGVYLVTARGNTIEAPRPLPDPTARRTDLAAHGEAVLIAWEGRDVTGSRILAAQTHDRGATFGAPIELSALGVEAALPIALAVGDGFLVLWTERQGHAPTWTSRRVPREPAATGPVSLSNPRTLVTTP